MHAISEMEPRDAYAARLLPDGTISVQATLADPLAVPTIIIEFGLGKKVYQAIYHDAADKWEFFGKEEWFVASAGDLFYGYANTTVDKFASKLLSGPCPDKFRDQLTRKLAEEIRDEIDKDIVNDLLIASGQSPPQVQLPQITLQPPPGTPRKLKVKWSLDTPTLTPTFDEPKLKSRLVN